LTAGRIYAFRSRVQSTITSGWTKWYFPYLPESPTNWPPRLSPIGTRTIDAGQTLHFTVSATDPEGDPLTFSVTNLPTGASFDVSTREFSWTPTFSQAGTHAGVHFEVDDAHLKDWEDITIVVVNHAPDITSTPATSGTEGILYTYDIEATDPNAGDALVSSLTAAPTGMSIDSATGLIQWTPTHDQIGDKKVEVQVTDQGGLSDTQSFTIVVQAGSQTGGGQDGGSQTEGDQSEGDQASGGQSDGDQQSGGLGHESSESSIPKLPFIAVGVFVVVAAGACGFGIWRLRKGNHNKSSVWESIKNIPRDS
jgi:hypothetical protein